MKHFLSKVTLSRPLGEDHYCRLMNRRAKVGSESPVRFLPHFFEENTKIRKVSDRFCAIKTTSRVEGNFRRNLVRNLEN